MYIFNIFLYFVFLQGAWMGDMSDYNQWVNAGAPCYEAVGEPTSPPPVCFYDPSNINQ